MKNKKHTYCEEWLKRGWKLEQEIRALKREQRLAAEQAEENNCGAEHALVYTMQIQEQTEMLFSVKLELFECIMRLENRAHRVLLTLRYLSFLTWEEIAQMMEVDVRHVYRLHREALIEAEAYIF